MGRCGGCRARHWHGRLDCRRGRWRRLGHRHRCRRVGQYALDHRRLAVGRLLRAAGDRGGVLLLVRQLVGGFDVVQPRIVVLEARELVVGRLQRLVGHHQHIDALLEFDLGDFRALLVEQERGHVHRNLAQHRSGVVLERLLLDDAQNLQRRTFRVADMARTTAARAGDGRTFAQRGTQPLAAHFHQAELADRAELHAGAVLAQGIAQPVLDFAAVAAFFHVDEVDHDQAAQVAQAHLARHFVGRFQVGTRGGFLDVAAADRACRVHVDRDQRFGVVDHDRTTAGQLHHAGIGRFDLVFDLEAREQRRIVAVALDAGRVFGHHVRHELLCLVVHVIGVDQDVADVMVEIVADRADHQRRFLVDQERALAALGGAVDGVPELEQVVQVPLQLGCAAADAGGARNDAHAVRVFELVQRFLEVGPVFAFDAARHATTARVVGHQHDVTAGQ